MKNFLIRPFEVKEVRDNGTFEGIASPFGELDSYRDIVMPGAFGKSIAAFKARGRKVPMLWQHSSREPIGVYTDLKETSTELYVHGECNMKVQKGIECHALMQQGALTGLSIGYNTIVSQWDEKQEIRSLIELELWEISPVTFPAADSARVTLVKSLEQSENLSDCEAILRDAGWSKSEATAFTSRVKAIAMRSDSANAHADSVARAMSILRQ